MSYTPAHKTDYKAVSYTPVLPAKETRSILGPVCRIEDCVGCIRDCKTVYAEARAVYQREGQLTAQELRHLKAIRNKG